MFAEPEVVGDAGGSRYPTVCGVEIPGISRIGDFPIDPFVHLGMAIGEGDQTPAEIES